MVIDNVILYCCTFTPVNLLTPIIFKLVQVVSTYTVGQSFFIFYCLYCRLTAYPIHWRYTRGCTTVVLEWNAQSSIEHGLVTVRSQGTIRRQIKYMFWDCRRRLSLWMNWSRPICKLLGLYSDLR